MRILYKCYSGPKVLKAQFVLYKSATNNRNVQLIEAKAGPLGKGQPKRNNFSSKGAKKGHIVNLIWFKSAD